LQSAQRVEITAALAAASICSGEIDLVTDSKLVFRGCKRLRAGESVVQWKHADLWRQLAPAVASGRLKARWTKAHLSRAEALARGVPERDQLGNAAADSNAGSAALAVAPPAALAAQRQQDLKVLESVQRVLASVQLAVVQAVAASKSEQSRAPRLWSRVRRGARARGQSAGTSGHGSSLPGAPARDDAASGTAGSTVTGELLTAFFQGRSWTPHIPAQGPGRVWCVRCGGSSVSRASLLASACGGWQEALPPLATGMLMLGGLQRIGGDAALFEEVVRRRRQQLPRAPD